LRDRLARLEEEGIIRGYRADIAPDAAGVGAYLLLRLKRTPALDVIAALKQIPEVVSCSSVAGDIDLVVHLQAETIDRLNARRDEIARHPMVADLTTSIILRWDIGGDS
jgi:DNA-binding Lrp family transcriptional regulator